MIKILFKLIIVVLLLLLLIPMCRLLWHMLVKVGICTTCTMDPWGVAALFFTGLFLFFLVLIFKD